MVRPSLRLLALVAAVSFVTLTGAQSEPTGTALTSASGLRVPPNDATLPNPLIRQRADPFVVRHSDGFYYFTATVPEYDRIELRRATTIAGLATADAKTIWRKHATGPMGAHIWAPELHQIDGKWYIYFAAGEAEKIWNIRIYVLENASANPLEGEWIERGQLRTQWDTFSLDATPFEHRGQRYLIWAQSDPTKKHGTDLYLSRMAAPTELTGPQMRLTTPEYDWEKVRYPVNEGPSILVRHGRIFVTYSAAGTGAEYCLGLLSADAAADLLDPSSWTKSPTPVFATNEANGLYGPGHNSFTVAADGTTDLLVYHARNYSEIVGDPLRDPNRHTRVQPIRWRADGTPDFGVPARETDLGPLTAALATPAPAETAGFKLGSAANPAGTSISTSSRSLLRDGRPWTPVMGEFHYSRIPAAEWREELLKMKAGGIDIVATYVFWIYHEETEGAWNWSGSNDLRRFVATAQEAGLHVIVRCGPWCHGEVRNGGLPDWLVARGNVRSEDPAYLASATSLYRQIAAQLRGLLWKDGGPVIGIQLENEYRGPAEHLLTLKRIAREAGLDTPLYTRTGWPELATPMPFGEILPLYGVYAEGFWDRELISMPGNYWAGFHFSTLRTDANIANEALGRRETRDAPDIARYPYLTCEIGGGMMSSYHRRILVDPLDIEATTLLKLGSGSTSPGYYMYHGGTNGVGRLTTLMEEQASPMTNWNDMPVLNYDFQAPLGQFGQIRPHYHRLRRLHLFLHSFGSPLAETAVALPDRRPDGRHDLDTLRWSVRSDGRRGFLFVNNHERGRTLPPKPGVQFRLTPAGLVFPQAPFTVPTGAAFIWPFNLDLGSGVTLAYATAQPLTVLDDGLARTFVFAETPGIPAEFAFDAAGIASAIQHGACQQPEDRLVFPAVAPAADTAITVRATDGREIRIVLLSDADSLALWRGTWQGRERLILSEHPLVIDGGALRITAADPRGETRQNSDRTPPNEIRGGSRSAAADRESLRVFPADDLASAEPGTGSLFAPLEVVLPSGTITSLATEQVRAAGPLRTIALGKAPKPVAAAPVAADFAAAAVWRIKLPADLDLATSPLLRLHYRGDCARVKIGDTFIMDDFCNGEPLEIGLARFAALLKSGELTIEILPLQKGAPIFLPAALASAAGDRAGVAELSRVELITRPEIVVGHQRSTP